MHSLRYLLSFLSFILIAPCFAQTPETIQIDTYYPAPYGVYAELTTTSNTHLAAESGNVGIGTTSPRATLHINDRGLNTHAFKVDTSIGFLSSFVIHSTYGRVGIGTDDPQAKLDVNGDIRAESNAWGNCVWRSLSSGQYDLMCNDGEYLAGLRYEGATWTSATDTHVGPEIPSVYCCKL